MVSESVKRINELTKRISHLEGDIAKETKYIKDLYVKASKSMPEKDNYFLSGVQATPFAKSYLLTKKGIEVVGEEALPIPAFIDEAIRYANYPKKKIEVLMVLAKHLEEMSHNLV